MEASTLLILIAYVFSYTCDLSFCASQVFLVVLFEALSQHSSLHPLTIDFDCAIKSAHASETTSSAGGGCENVIASDFEDAPF
jgi:hypothetical protein